MTCKVCGSRGPMKQNMRGRDTDTCLSCHKKFKRLQHLHYVLPLNKIKDHQVAEHNTLVDELVNKTTMPKIVPGIDGWVHEVAVKSTGSSNVKAPIAIDVRSANAAFILYADAVPRKVIFNQDKRFSGSLGQKEREEYPDQYQGSIQYLFDIISSSKVDDMPLVFDKDLWAGNLCGFAMDNSEVLSMECVEPEHMYHWLCFVYSTMEATMEDDKSIQGIPDDYLKYSIDPYTEKIIITE